MDKNSTPLGRIKKFFYSIYLQIFKINDTPQKVSLGLGLGVFSGILPGTGIIASLILAAIFKANRASALLGSLFTNTWISILTFIPAVKIGALILGVSWQEVCQEWKLILTTFSWGNFLKLSVLEIIFPVALGYVILSLCLGAAVYLSTLVILFSVRKKTYETP